MFSEAQNDAPNGTVHHNNYAVLLKLVHLERLLFAAFNSDFSWKCQKLQTQKSRFAWTHSLSLRDHQILLMDPCFGIVICHGLLGFTLNVHMRHCVRWHPLTWAVWTRAPAHTTASNTGVIWTPVFTALKHGPRTVIACTGLKSDEST